MKFVCLLTCWQPIVWRKRIIGKSELSGDCKIGKEGLPNSYEMAQLVAGSQKKRNHNVVPHSAMLKYRYARQLKLLVWGNAPFRLQVPQKGTLVLQAKIISEFPKPYRIRRRQLTKPVSCWHYRSLNFMFRSKTNKQKKRGKY